MELANSIGVQNSDADVAQTSAPPGDSGRGDNPRINREHYFGACPACGGNDGYLNVGCTHWIVCDKDKFKWSPGSNIFSCWRDDSPEVWDANVAKLEGYQEVEPLPYEPEDEPSPEVDPDQVEYRPHDPEAF